MKKLLIGTLLFSSLSAFAGRPCQHEKDGQFKMNIQIFKIFS